jgi:hypothetical protein
MMVPEALRMVKVLPASPDPVMVGVPVARSAPDPGVVMVGVAGGVESMVSVVPVLLQLRAVSQEEVVRTVVMVGAGESGPQE